MVSRILLGSQQRVKSQRWIARPDWDIVAVKVHREIVLMRQLKLFHLGPLLAVLPAAAGFAQGYPAKPIRVVSVSMDAAMRIVGQKLTDAWGQQIVIDQRTGAGGIIAAEFVSRAPADGYTLLMATSTHTMTPNFYKISYDMAKDFAPVTQMAAASFVLSVHPSLPVKTVKELVALAKQRPGVMNYGSGGGGSPGHLIGEMLRLQTGINIVHVPYKSLAQAVTELVSGQLQLMFVVSTAAMPQLQAGRIRGLAIASARRSNVVPDVPTMAEAGIRDFEATGWYGILAPAGTPAPITARLHDEIAKALKLPDVVQRLAGLGLDTVGSSQQEFGEFVRTELAKWSRIAKASGAKVE